MEMPTFDEFVAFLTNRCRLLETLHPQANVQSSKPPTRKTNTLVSLNKDFNCTFCNLSHTISQCNAFTNLSTNDRIKEIKKRHLCLNCLRKGHTLNDCKSKYTCKRCNKKHHTLIHIEPQQKSNTEPSTSTVEQARSTEVNTEIVLTSHAALKQSCSQILLSTACVTIKDYQDNWVPCRVLLDNGSQSNFITSELHKTLNLPSTHIQSTIVGINQTSMGLNRKTEVIIRSSNERFQTRVDCLIIPKITENLPTIPFDASCLNIPSNIKLADPNFNKEGRIDILVGAGIFWNLLCVGQIKLGNRKPILQKSRLGWILSGPLMSEFVTSRNLLCNVSLNLNQQIEKFWTLEECVARSIYSVEQQECEEYFIKTIKRDESGKFIVNIPFNSKKERLGDSRRIALKRFYSLERQLALNPDLQSEYVKFMNEYETLGHMKRINESSDNDQDSFYYFPHHAVIKTSSTTTKTRVVFDGSAKTTTGVSLNDAQKIGPIVQNELFTILLRFRRHAYVLTADIEKMYRQIFVSPEDRKYQRIFWRSHNSQSLKCYELQTVTYGTASAPFLATRCLNQLAIEYKSEYPQICDIIANDFYVDDLLTGAESIEDLFDIKIKVNHILNCAGFDLRKWLSNCNTLVEKFNGSEKFQFGDDSESRTLGILWNPVTDTFKYIVQNFDTKGIINKRIILSTIAKIFDPLGLLGPIIVVAKLIIQSLWQLHLSWDESVSHDIHHQWTKYLEQLSTVNTISIPRHVLQHKADDIQCHGFSDASEKAYGACVYIRSRNNQNNVIVNLFCSKSRVAPLHKITLPRLELCAAVLLSRLMAKVKESSGINFNSYFFWSDSTITLNWIKSHPSKWHTFVANRVSDIQTHSDLNEWFHVRSHDNPADLLSRGMTSSTLAESYLWWHGPSWLSQDNSKWPRQSYQIAQIKLLEMKQGVTIITKTQNVFLFERFSTLTKLQRVTSWCLRFISNCRKSHFDRQTGPISTAELNSTLMRLIKSSQEQCFATELQKLKMASLQPFKSNILSLNPFLDSNNLIRVGGRIRASNFSFDKKHPIILPKNHILTNLIIVHEHIRLLHCGPQGVLSSLRERYWPLGGKNSVKKLIHNCITCFKVKPRQTTYLMGDLPSSRINPSPVFYHCGIDYAGPFLLKEKKYRNTKFIKAYICLFICLTTKAIHLELVGDLTTETFIATLRRFISRRGKPHSIHSDNASNFVGAQRNLQELSQFLNKSRDVIINTLANDNINWHFIPPRSPHFGGLWEAGIKSTKSHLKRVIGNKSLCFEDFYTVLTQIEAVLNSRPISPLSDDPNDLNPLTPGHFLIGRSLTSIPDPDVTDTSETKLSRYQHLQKLVQHFWNRWSKEYITELQTRTKWTKSYLDHLKLNSLVLIRDNNQPPMNWKLGRVVQLHPGTDGIVRVVSIRTTDTTIKRAVNQVYVLPISSN